MGVFGYMYKVMTNKYVVVMSVAGTTGGCLLLLWSRPSGAGKARYKVSGSLLGKTFVVTGATSGIGKGVADTLAKKKARVILACKDMNKCRVMRRDMVLDSGNKYVACRHLDLASCDSIQAFAERMIREENIDVLINNAGVLSGKQRKVTKDGFEEMLGVNYLGQFLLTMLLVDRMVQRDVPVRIVNLCSVSHPGQKIEWDDFNRERSYNENKMSEVFGSSNLCKNMWTRLLAERLKDTKVTVNAVYPGNCNTYLHRNMNYQKFFLSRWFFVVERYLFMRTTKEGAAQVLFVATSPDVEGQNGKYYVNCEKTLLNPQSRDRQAQLRLWVTSEKWTKLRERKEKIEEGLRRNPPKWAIEEEAVAGTGQGGWGWWLGWVPSFISGS